MNKLLRNSAKILVLSLMLLTIAGCYSGKQATMKASAQTENRLSAWLVCWDAQDGKKEYKAFGNRLNEVCFFSAYFNQDGKLCVPSEFAVAKRPAGKNKKIAEYLTVVNDRLLACGAKEYKKTEFLKPILETEQTRKEHINEIIALAKAGHFDGVEIDYEKIWQDDGIKDKFIKLIEELYAAAAANDLKLRVVLEPGAPFSSISLPAGPKYVVMLYNLYGLHSGPGPKANKAFINKTMAKISCLPEPKAVAFSAGGCLWGSDGEKRFITETEAKQLLKQYKADATRDNESKAVTFKYRKGTTVYVVWYADAVTLDYWIKLAEEEGVRDIAIWRLGSNLTLEKIRRLN